MSAAAQRARTEVRIREAILERLKEIFPRGLHTHELIEEFGHCARSRATELRYEGWDIPEEFDDAAGEAVYRLASLTKGEPKAEIVEGVRITIRSDRTAFIEPYAEGEFSEDLAGALEGEAVDRLVGRFNVDVSAVDFIRTPKKRGIVISLVDRGDPEQDFFEWCMTHLDRE